MDDGGSYLAAKSPGPDGHINAPSPEGASCQYGISSVVPFSRLNRTTVSTHVWTRSSTNLIVLSPEKTSSVPSAVCPTCVYWISPCPSSSSAVIHCGCHTRSGCSASCRSSMPIRPARSTFRPCGYWALGRSVSVPSGCSATFAYPRPLLYSSTNHRISSSTGLVLAGPRPLLGVSVIVGLSLFARHRRTRATLVATLGGPPDARRRRSCAPAFPPTTGSDKSPYGCSDGSRRDPPRQLPRRASPARAAGPGRSCPQATCRRGGRARRRASRIATSGRRTPQPCG